MSSDTVAIAPRFCGPPSSGHGGYVSGLAADASLADESRRARGAFVWALDCTGGLAVLPVPEGRAIVLGEFSVRIDGDVVPGDRCVAVGGPLHVDGRKRLAGSVILSEDGVAVALGRAVWIEAAEAAFLPGPERSE